MTVLPAVPVRGQILETGTPLTSTIVLAHADLIRMEWLLQVITEFFGCGSCSG